RQVSLRDESLCMLGADERAEVGGSSARGEHNEWSFRSGSELFRDLEARHVGQEHVEQDDVGAKSADRRDRGCAVRRVAHDVAARRLEQLPGKPSEAGVIVDDQRPGWHGIIVAQSERPNVLDFPELRAMSGKRPTTIVRPLPTLAAWFAAGRRTKNDRARRTLYRSVRRGRDRCTVSPTRDRTRADPARSEERARGGEVDGLPPPTVNPEGRTSRESAATRGL